MEKVNSTAKAVEPDKASTNTIDQPICTWPKTIL